MGIKRKKHAQDHRERMEKHEKGDRKIKEEEGSEVTRDVTLYGLPLVCISGYSCLVLAMYVYNMYPGISGGDSGELIAAAHELGVAHPPGYPVFTMLSWLAIKLIPYGNIAWRVNLLNAVFSAMAAFFFAATIYRYTSSVGASISGCLLWSLSKLTWTWSTSAEVFTLNNMFTALILYLMVTYHHTSTYGKGWLACVGALVCGLALCNQHTIVVYVVCVAVWVIVDLKLSQLLTLRLLMQLGVCFIFGLLPYMYLPVSAYYNMARWTWGDQASIYGLLKHLLRLEYGTFDLAKGQDPLKSNLFSGLRAYLVHITSEMTVVGVVLAIVGAGICLLHVKRQKGSLGYHGNYIPLCVTMAMCTVYLLLFSWRANLDLENKLFLGVVERFWMQADCVIVLLATIGLYTVIHYIEEKWSFVLVIGRDLCIIAAILSFQVNQHYQDCNQHNNTVVWEFGSRLLHNMPQNALVLTEGDLPSNVLRYLYLCENQRPDVQVFDQQILTYSWSVPMLRDHNPGITFPGHHMELKTGYLDGQRVFNFKSFLDANYNRGPIIGCIGVQNRELSWQDAFFTFPYGPCSWIIKKTEYATFYATMDAFLENIQNISSGWSYPYHSFDATSWERVVTDEIWNAKINIGMWFYDRAVEQKDPKKQANFFIKSYQFYKQAVEPLQTKDIPDYWHKNYALVCERMLGISHQFPKAAILNDTIDHFQAFIDKDPADKDVKAIEDAIVKLKTYLGQW